MEAEAVMKFARPCAAALVLALSCDAALADAPAASAFLERLAGEWRGAGEVNGKDGQLGVFGRTRLTRN